MLVNNLCSLFLIAVNEDSGTNGILLDSSSEFGEDEEVFRASLESAFTSKEYGRLYNNLKNYVFER